VTDVLKLMTYFGERDRTGGRLVADALLDIYGTDGIRASLLLRGAEGFGAIHHLHTDRLLSLSNDLPVVSLAVDLPERIETALGQILEIKHRGLITLERARLLTSERDLPAAAAPGTYDRTGAGRPAGRPVTDTDAKLTVFLGRRDRAGGQPAFVGVCELLHRHMISGACVLLGVDGTNDGRRARARFFDRNPGVPMIVIAVGSSLAITALLPELGSLVPDPRLLVEEIRVCKRDGASIAGPHELPELDATGRPIWQKLTLYTSESATVDGRSLHLELIGRLRRTEAAGATSLRGIWGYHGDQAPHGDRLLQLRRRVPIVTTLIDSPSQIARSFEIVDELTGQTGLVTSEAVPAMLAISSERRIGGLELASLPAGPVPGRP